MKHLKTEITIQASADKVWEKLTNFEDYDQWNPFIKSIKGEAKVGTGLEVTMISRDKPATFTPQVTKCIEGKEFEWLGSGMMGGFKGRHYFILERISDSETLFVHGEFFSGWLSPLIMKMIGADTEMRFNAMNEAMAAAFKEN